LIQTSECRIPNRTNATDDPVLRRYVTRPRRASPRPPLWYYCFSEARYSVTNSLNSTIASDSGTIAEPPNCVVF
jgi:hypothetical protein